MLQNRAKKEGRYVAGEVLHWFIIVTILMACVAVYSEADGNKSRLKQ